MNKDFYLLTVEEHCSHVITSLLAQNRIGTARNYEATIESLSQFCDISSMLVADINSQWVKEYNQWLEASGKTSNTISFYNRVLRALFNLAVKDGQAEQTFPFQEAFTGNDNTRKRALDIHAMRRIAALAFPLGSELGLARDVFLFSFYARGMSFVDLAFLTYENVEGDAISYRRRKTGTRLMLQLEPCMREIMNRYRPFCVGNHVFPFVRSATSDEAYEQYRYGLCRCNLLLKEVGRRADVPFPLNTYVARHSWATLARNMNVPLSVISAGMGHSSENTTRIYLDTLPSSTLDHANHSLLSRVFPSEC